MAAERDPNSAPDQPDNAEREMRDAEARALAETELGSGLLARQAVPSEAVAAVPVLKVCPQCGREYETTSRFCPEDGTALRPKGSDSLIGRTLAERYHILKLIGEGGMGRVYLGEHVKMNRQCAIKVMSASLVNDTESAARFAREASNAARIIHPNVAAVFDFGESEGVVYLVMEYVEGEPLSSILQREAPLSLQRSVDITNQIADGLNAAHELGIIHRDLKPDNILVMRTRSGKEVAKVVDFGIAKAVQEGVGEGLTKTGQVIGTPEFMSPEQLYGDTIDARSDLYALGCILHLMLTAQPPFDAPSREQMIKRRISEEPPSVQTIDPGIPDVVSNVVAKLLKRSPSERYGSAAEVRDALAGNVARRSGFEVRGPIDNKYTPRSAPTVAFLHATQATTEVTVIPQAPLPAKRSAYIVSALVLTGVAVVLFLKTATPPVTSESSEPATLDTAQKTTAVVTPPAPVVDTTLKQEVAAPKQDSTKRPVAAPVDTAKRNARLAKQRADDSVVKATEAGALAARSVVGKYAQAFQAGNVSALTRVYPAMPPKEQDSYQKNYFDRTDRIDAAVNYGETRVVGDSAQVDFTIKLNMVLKSKQSEEITFPPQRAKLVRRSGVWQIIQVGGRS